MVTTRAGHCAKKVMQDKVQEEVDDLVCKSTITKYSVADASPLDTDVTPPVTTNMLPVQAETLRAQLSVFPHGNRGPKAHIFLAGMEQELLRRNSAMK